MGNENWGVPSHVEPVVSAAAEMLNRIRTIRIGRITHGLSKLVASGRYDSGS